MEKNTKYQYTKAPKKVLFDDRLTSNEKMIMLLLIEQDQRLGERYDGEYYTSNEWLMKNVGIKEWTMKKSISKLKRLGYIKDTKKTTHYLINWQMFGTYEAPVEEVAEDTSANVIDFPTPKTEAEPMKMAMNFAEEVPQTTEDLLCNISEDFKRNGGYPNSCMDSITDVLIGRALKDSDDAELVRTAQRNPADAHLILQRYREENVRKIG